MNILETGKGEGGLRCRPRPNWGHPEGPKTRYVASIPTHQNCAACSSRKARRCPGERLKPPSRCPSGRVVQEERDDPQIERERGSLWRCQGLGYLDRGSACPTDVEGILRDRHLGGLLLLGREGKAESKWPLLRWSATWLCSRSTQRGSISIARAGQTWKSLLDLRPYGRVGLLSLTNRGGRV
jgi:hypothetical protein